MPLPRACPSTSGEATPTLELERTLAAQGFRYIAAMDEVGRGALAGPVSMGVVVIDALGAHELAEVKDSKLLKPDVRAKLSPIIKDWAQCYAVGHATSVEIDTYGITVALKFAGLRAYHEILEQGYAADCILLDGKSNILQSGTDTAVPAEPQGLTAAAGSLPRVVTRIKADRTCGSVAAASILAKVERDCLMDRLAALYPPYRWDRNKGYGTASHRAAIKEHGTTVFHRVSWKLM